MNPTDQATTAHSGRTLTRVARTAGVAGLLGTLALCPFPVGSQDQLWWGLMALMTLAASALLLAGAGLRGRFLEHKTLLAVLTTLILLMILQLTPLPSGLVGLVSSRRVQLAEQASSALGEEAGAYLSLTASTKQTRDALLLYTACFAAFVCATLVFRRSRQLRLLYSVLAVPGAIMALYAFIVFFDDGARLHGAYTNANRFASLLGMCLLAGVAWRLLAARANKRAEIVVATIAAATCGLAFVSTLSRMGIASLSAAILLLTFVALRRKETASHQADVRSRRLLAVGTSLAASAILASLLASFDPVWQRYSVLFDQELAGNGRLVCWRMALGVVRDFPLLGSGAGSFQHVFPLYQEPGRLAGFWKYAHNDYLNALSDLGVLGLGLVLVAAALWFRAVWPSARSSSTVRRVASWTGIGVVTFVAFHSLADFVLKQPANALVFSVIAGSSVGAAAFSRSVSRTRSRVPLLATAVLCVIAAACVVPVALAGRAYPMPADGSAPAVGVDVMRNALRHDPYDVDVRYHTARLVAGAAPEDHLARTSALAILAGGPTDQLIDARALYLAGVLMWQGGDDRADAAMRSASGLARAYPSITRAVGVYFIRRLVESRGEHPFALATAVESLRMANTTAPAAGSIKSSLAMLESVGAVEHLATVVPDIEWAVSLLADHHGKHARNDTAVRVLDSYLERHRDSVSTRFFLTLSTYRDRAGDVQGATVARIDYVMDTAADTRLAAAAGVVRRLASKKRNAESAMFVRALQRRHPDEPAALRARAEFARLSRDYLTAYQLLSQSVEAAGGPDDHYALAQLALKLRRPIEAERHLNRAIEMRPSAPQYWASRATIREQAGEIALAVQDLHTALHARPGDDRIRLRLSKLLLESKRMEELVSLWRDASEARPRNALVLEQLARALFASARFDEAIATARAAFAANPKRTSLRAFLKQIDPDGPASRTP